MFVLVWHNSPLLFNRCNWYDVSVLIGLFVCFICLNSGKCECALFGDYVDDLNKKMEKSSKGLPA